MGFLGYNMFAYCNNNPIISADKNGEWLNIVIGAFVGALINVATAVYEGKPLDEVIVSGVCGAVSGGLTAAGFGAIAGAATSFIDSAYGNVKSVINGDTTVGEAIVGTVADTALGAAFGAMGSGNSAEIKKSFEISKAGWNGLKTLVSETTLHPAVKKTAKTAVKKALKYAGRALVSDIASDTISTATTKGFSRVSRLAYNYYERICSS